MEKRYVISISLGNYIHGTGGTGKVVLEHQQVYRQHGISYFHISPFEKTVKGRKVVSGLYNVLLDGVDLGIFSEKQVMAYLYKLQKQEWVLDSIVLHHLVRCDLGFISKLCRSSTCPIVFYIHDYYSICPNHTLLKNNEVFCGYEQPSDAKCAGCAFSSLQRINYSRIREFMKDFQKRVIPIAPSSCALKIWEQAYPEMAGRGRVISHQITNNMIDTSVKMNQQIRIGYVGAQIPYKGWEQWCEFEKFCTANNLPYELYYFGKYPYHSERVKYVYVNVNKDNPTAMSDALRENNIDVAFLFSIWPETYSYTYFESWSAACAVITQKDSGNIADMVKKNENGIVYMNIKEFMEDAINPEQFGASIHRCREKRRPVQLDVNREGIMSLLSNREYRLEAADFSCFRHSILTDLVNLLYCTKHNLPVWRKEI